MVVHEGRAPASRKGPWTDQEDLQLVCFVGLFGERRWDFIAKVSGLSRTGKSCRLRWVNYLRPDLKRGQMNPQEERLVLQLHARWGNRWSRIARKLPGRTDNEIKNYWRTHMRKKAQERHENSLSVSSSSSCSSLSSSSSSSLSSLWSNPQPGRFVADVTTLIPENSVCEAGGSRQVDAACAELAERSRGNLMDQIWKDIAASDMLSFPVYEGEKLEASVLSYTSMASPLWEYCCDSLWKMDEDEFSAGNSFI